MTELLNLKNPFTVMIAATLAVLLFIAGGMYGNWQSKGDYNQLLEAYNSKHDEIVVERNRVVSLERAVHELTDENTDLLSLVAELKARPPEIRTVVRTETVLVPSEPTVITPDLPEEYLHIVGNGIVTGRFAQVEDEYRFDTYDLTFRNTLVITDKKTASLIQIASGYNPEVYHDVESDLIVRDLRELKLFEPHIGVGITGSLPSPDLTASVYTTLVHPAAQWDLVGVRVSGNKTNLKVGLDPVGYNLGHNLPVLTDLWVYPGASLDISGQVSADVTIGTKF